MKKLVFFSLVFVLVSVFGPRGVEASSHPIISSVQTKNVVGEGAQIEWSTDDPSTSKVVYGTTSGSYGLSSENRCDAGGNVTSHCVNLTGLAAATVYYYRVESTNQQGQITTSGEYQFTSGTSSSGSGSSGSGSGGETSSSIPTTPSGLSAAVAANGADVNLSWTDNSTTETEFKIYYRGSSGSWSYLTSVGSGITTFTHYNHPSGTYDYHVNACNTAGCSADSNTATVTKADSTSGTGNITDTTAPVISNVRAENIIGPGAQIKWDTDDASDSRVAYGTSSGNYSLGSTDRCDAGGNVTNHCVNLTGLAAATVYYYQVESKNAAGLNTRGAEFTFTSASSSGTIPGTGSNKIYGYVKNATGQATSSADVRYCSNPNSSCLSLSAGTSDSTGYWQLLNPTVASYRFWVAGTNFSQAEEISYTSGQVRVPDLVTQDQKLWGYVKNSTGQAISGTTVKYRFSSTSPAPTDCTASSLTAFAASDSTGYWFLSSPPSGYYCFYATGSNLQTQIVYPSFYSSGSIQVQDLILPTTITPSVIPQAPSGLSASLASNGVDVNLAWTDNSGDETEFKIYYRSSGGSWSYLTYVGTGVTTFTHYNHPSGTYDYHVNACNTAGCSADSNTATVTKTGVVASDFYVDPVNTSPKNGESKVDVNVTIKVRLSKEFDPASTLNQFFLLGNAATPTVSIPGNFQIFADGFEFKPSSSLPANATFTYRVFTSLKDKNGNSLSSPFQASFSTGGSAANFNSRIEGLVLDGAGKPVGSAWYYVRSEDFTASFWGSTDSAGAFVLSIPAGTYYAEVYPPQTSSGLGRPPLLKFSIGDNETKQLVLQFASTAKIITGQVAFADGRIITDAGVGAYSPETGQWTGTLVDKNGNYTLRLGGGKWVLGTRPMDPARATWSFSGSFVEIEFAKDSLPEAKTVNFIISVADAPLVVRAVDNTGKNISNAAVVVDSISAGSEAISVRPPPEFKNTDSSGLASFLLKAGTYYVRAYLPSQLGYLNPQEQVVNAVSGKGQEIKIVFVKKDATTTTSLKGTTKLADGTSLDAFIWGWSEKGGFISGRSGSQGEFNFQVSANDRWHLGAGKEINSVPYKADEIVVEVGPDGSFVELVLVKFAEVPLPPPVSVSQTATQQIVAQTNDGAEVTLPPQAAASSGTVSVEIRPTIEAPAQAGAQPVSTVYDVTIKDAGGNQIRQLAAEAEIVLPYSEAELKAQGVSEDNLVPSYFDEGTGAWIKVDSYTIDQEKNQVVARVKHLTRFALVAAADITPPAAPSETAIASLGKGGIKLTWKNPVKDFDHAKIYRSGEAGKLGKLINSEVTGNQFIDTDVSAGITYHYTVRAVDPAGNESNNTGQVKIKPVETSTPEKQPSAATPAPPGPGPATVVKITFTRNLKLGLSGDDVKTLQEVLVKEGILKVKKTTRYFGPATRRALLLLQKKYNLKASGVVDDATRQKLNELAGSTPQVRGLLLRYLGLGSRGDDVRVLQELLGRAGLLSAQYITGYFGTLTRQAVINFQAKYADEILRPLGLEQGTGFVGVNTLTKLHKLYP